jgi:hypothetical protein
MKPLQRRSCEECAENEFEISSRRSSGLFLCLACGVFISLLSASVGFTWRSAYHYATEIIQRGTNEPPRPGSPHWDKVELRRTG